VPVSLKVIKSNGKVEEFSSEKIVFACQRAQVPAKDIQRIVKIVENWIYNFIPTSEIRKWVIGELDKLDKKYSHGFKYKRKIIKFYSSMHLNFIILKKIKQGILPFISQPVDESGTPYLGVDKQGCEIRMVDLNEENRSLI